MRIGEPLLSFGSDHVGRSKCGHPKHGVSPPVALTIGLADPADREPKLAQSAFQTGSLAAAISAEQLLQPLTGVALGIGLLDEHIDVTNRNEVSLLIVALVAMVWGVLALAHAEQEALEEGVPPIALAD